MNQVAENYNLKATPEIICSHLKISKGERSLLKGKSPEELYEFVSQQLQERSQFYEKAQHVIDVNVLDNFDKIDFVVDEILKIRGLKD
jgi:shikimate kinase